MKKLPSSRGPVVERMTCNAQVMGLKPARVVGDTIAPVPQRSPLQHCQHANPIKKPDLGFSLGTAIEFKPVSFICKN